MLAHSNHYVAPAPHIERAALEGIANSRHRLAQMTALLRERRGTLDILTAVLQDRQRAPDALSCAPASGLTT